MSSGKHTMAVGVGIRRCWSVYHRELLSMFVSPMAYIVLLMFLLINAVTFNLNRVFSGGNLELLLAGQYSSPIFWFLVVLIPPLLTMRSISEEHKSGTLDQLMTTGLSEPTLVVAKFLAALSFYLLLWCALLPPYLILEQTADLDWGMIATVHCGLLLVGILFTSIGVFASSLTENQLVSAIIAVTINLFVIFLNFFRFLYEPGDQVLRIFQYVSPFSHFREDFSRGVIDLRYVMLYVSFAVLFLFLASKSLERRRWW